MMRSVKDLEKNDIVTREGEMGKLMTFYFNERTNEVLYMVVDTRKWLPGKQVLVSPDKVTKPIDDPGRMDIELTKEELEEQPAPEEHKPISAVKEESMLRNVLPGALWYPAGVEPRLTFDGTHITFMDEDLRKETDNHIRSTRMVEDYRIEAQDGRIGHLDDMVIDTDDWRIRYYVVETRNIIPGKKVLISPDWVKGIDWDENKIVVDHTKDEIKNSPEFDPRDPINRKYEEVLYDYYGRPYYWK
ncbi:MAG: hypothetical protein R6V01_08125 [Thermoplasmatota archaeon]